MIRNRLLGCSVSFMYYKYCVLSKITRNVLCNLNLCGTATSESLYTTIIGGIGQEIKFQ